MTDQKLIDDVVTAFADRDLDAPSRDDIARVLEVFETSLRRCGCDACTTARRERIGLTEHDITSLARVLHEVVYSPGASFDRAVPGIQEYMRACAEKVAAALPWVVPTSEAHTPTDDEREAITDEGLWDFASDLLDAWNIEDLNPPSLIEDFRDRFVRRFRHSECTPTDDEREALIALKLASFSKRMSDGYPSIIMRTNEEAADLVLAAGFRRSEVPEPSAEDYPDGWFVFGSHAPYPWVGKMEFSAEKDEAGMPLWERPVQGEPSDAQALADEIEGRMRRQEWLPADLAIRAVAALRAAGGAR